MIKKLTCHCGGVLKNIPDNTRIMGYPAKDIRKFLIDNK